MPKLWTETIATHRQSVRDAILEATAALATRQGLHALTMSTIAQHAGIGRATLYKYFSDVEAIVGAWHEKEIETHLRLLTRVRDSATSPAERVEAVLHAYAHIAHGLRAHAESDLAARLHRGSHAIGAERELRKLVTDLLAEAAHRGVIRDDVPPAELANYCLYSLAGAAALANKAAVRRLVEVTLAGLR